MDSRKETAAGLEAAAVPVKDQPRQPASAQREAAQSKTHKKRHPALRALLWTLRALVVPVLCVAAILGGMYVGYAILGKRPGDEVFQIETWKHMYDLVFAD
ncbi:DNA-directed RNA polymerase subunit beta [Paenibacillus taihuensis]|uniref:DNA-directed RNA polymerase subunit beta n=1 Tax=Paenibacillus taihuensis TaxID=1156355 RepID=A0A3D9SP69_9BACL|nr:DNA-directed RNA polymerase subunit beta [Paenibacillus taihuensis]REE91476.1 DNA-directed RNA polymerase subunit beta [Paenibacillus taihuensis]